MSSEYRYQLPVKQGDTRQLGQLTGAACALECAEIIKHAGLVVLSLVICKMHCVYKMKSVSFVIIL